jgi:hypothetical protein
MTSVLDRLIAAALRALDAIYGHAEQTLERWKRHATRNFGRSDGCGAPSKQVGARGAVRDAQT